MTRLTNKTSRVRGKTKVSPSPKPRNPGTVKFKSEVFEALHRSASALRSVGAMDAQTMRNFDVACIETPTAWNKSKVRELRKKYQMSQPVLAAHLNSTPSTIAQWESGAKQPSKIAAKLLQVLAKHGPEVLR